MATETKGDADESTKEEDKDPPTKRSKPKSDAETSAGEDELRRLEEELRAEEAKLAQMQKRLLKMRQKRRERKKPPPLVYPLARSPSNGVAAGPPPLRRPDSADSLSKKTKLNYLGRPTKTGPPKGAPNVITDYSNRLATRHPSEAAVLDDDIREAKRRIKSKQFASRQTFYKQLERSVAANVPSPRPPPDQWPVCPWAGNSHFASLLGLETVVEFVQTGKLPEGAGEGSGMGVNQYMKCSNCGLDFSPVWRLVRDAQKQCIVCERCENSRIKQALLNQHARRLQSAFSQANQQEKEFEMKMKQQVIDEAVRVRDEKVWRIGSLGQPSLVVQQQRQESLYSMQTNSSGKTAVIQPKLVRSDNIGVDIDVQRVG